MDGLNMTGWRNQLKRISMISSWKIFVAVFFPTSVWLQEFKITLVLMFLQLQRILITLRLQLQKYCIGLDNIFSISIEFLDWLVYHCQVRRVVNCCRSTGPLFTLVVLLNSSRMNQPLFKSDVLWICSTLSGSNGTEALYLYYANNTCSGWELSLLSVYRLTEVWMPLNNPTLMQWLCLHQLIKVIGFILLCILFHIAVL